MTGYECADCGLDTWEAKEYYMVHDWLWLLHGSDLDMLCVGCLETRMGRRLEPSDFMEAPVNWTGIGQHSERLAERIGSLLPPDIERIVSEYF